MNLVTFVDIYSVVVRTFSNDIFEYLEMKILINSVTLYLPVSDCMGLGWGNLGLQIFERKRGSFNGI